MPEWLTTVLFLFVNGLIWGLIIALIALGLSLIFGVMGIVNMAHGDIYMVGAVIALALFPHVGNFWLALLIVPLIIAAIAIPVERFVLRPYEGHHSVDRNNVNFLYSAAGSPCNLRRYTEENAYSLGVYL